MQHCTPEQLALAALREPLPADDADHLAGCEQCRTEVISLQRAVDAVAVPQLAAPGAPVAPPPGVWAGIAAATGVSATPRTDVARQAPAAEEPAQPAAEVVPFRSRRRPLLLVAAAVVAGAALGAGAVAVVQSQDGGEPVTAVALDPWPTTRPPVARRSSSSPTVRGWSRSTSTRPSWRTATTRSG
ncbi:hypothetical protein [Blastococcus brunescens]|uniref:Zinc-finger domain-containing protein n=1 Tax=Blastococcus brunescens TaxID=1564165 RepID=A0ABZ1AZP1_9ACTN|nr:hypothetical protein [Blastococcus sp. BMG 8361]WRL64014.1 hypothetical protein U6N30_31230 [Blastococcus sp. BMG 8361]